MICHSRSGVTKSNSNAPVSNSCRKLAVALNVSPSKSSSPSPDCASYKSCESELKMISTMIMTKHQPHFTSRAEVEYCCNQPTGLAVRARDSLRLNDLTPNRGTKYCFRSSENELSDGVSRHDLSILHAPTQVAASNTI